MLKQGQLIRDVVGNVGVIIEIDTVHPREPFNRNKRTGITRERLDYFCQILWNEGEIRGQHIFYRHNSYQLRETYYTIDTRPEDVMTPDLWLLEVYQ